jgi:hypothetical protein
LEIEESPGALDVGQCGRIALHVKLVQLPARDRESQIAHELLVVPLAHTVKVDDVEIKIVQHLNVRWRFVEEDLRAARESFDVCRMLGQHRDDFLGEAVFAADVWKRANHISV